MIGKKWLQHKTGGKNFKKKLRKEKYQLFIKDEDRNDRKGLYSMRRGMKKEADMKCEQK